MIRITSTQLTRTAEVVLKEWRRPVLMLREMPRHISQPHAMLALSEMGLIIAPPVRACYAEPHWLEDMVDQIIGRVLDVFSIDMDLGRRRREKR